MAEPLRLLADRMATPIGDLAVVADPAGGLRAVEWADQEARLQRHLRLQAGAASFALAPAVDPFGHCAALRAYFAGDLRAIEALPVADIGTPFQRAVWRSLRAIPPGTMLSYGALAARLGRPAAARAVGAANGANPVSVVVPCHRLVGTDGSLTGYGGGGERKRWLLAHEVRGARSR